MVIDSKVRKMARFGDEKKSLIVNIFHTYHHLQTSVNVHKSQALLVGEGEPLF